MDKVHDYHPTLDELKVAAERLLDNGVAGVGVFYNTQIRKGLRLEFLRALDDEARKLGWSNEVRLALRQEQTCSECLRFFSRAGHLVYSKGGQMTSVYWNPDVVTDPLFKAVVERLKIAVEDSAIVSIYNAEGPYRRAQEWTNNAGGRFRHFHINPRFLQPRDTLNQPIHLHHVDRYPDKVAALKKLVTDLDYANLLFVDQLFQTGELRHVQNTGKNFESFKGLMMHVNNLAGFKPTSAAGTPMRGREQRLYDVALNNALWVQAGAHPELLDIKNSLLGVLIERIKEDRPKDQIVAFWNKQTDGLHYRRPTAEASASAVQNTATFLTENEYDLAQVVALESEIPAFWVEQPLPVEEKPVKPLSFQEFADAKAGKSISQTGTLKTQNMDTGYFVNEVLRHVREMSVNLTGIAFKPVVVNRCADLRAKPILNADKPERRQPFVAFSYDKLIRADNMVMNDDDDSVVVFPIRSIGWGVDIDIRSAGEEALVFWLGRAVVPQPPRPALFSTTLLPEFYPHRHAIENYMRTALLANPVDERAVGIVVGHNPAASDSGYMNFTVKLDEEGARLFGASTLRVGLSPVAKAKPKMEPWPVIRSNLVSRGDIKVDDAVDPKYIKLDPAEEVASADSPIEPA